MARAGTPPSDNEIVQRCRNDHNESFVFLYDRYVKKIYDFLFFRTMNKELAEDLTSETFIRALERLQTYQYNKGTFQAWLYRIARNLLIDEFRKRKPTEPIDLHQDLASGIDLLADTHHKLEAEQIFSLLQQLPLETRELVMLRLWEELPYAAIAEMTGKTEGSLKMQFSRAVAQLAKAMHVVVVFVSVYLYSH